MSFEIEFFPVGNGDNSGDAITVRYHDGQAWRVIVIDGGYYETGEAVCEHVKRWYQTETIDHLISTHPDNDHISGLRAILETMNVRCLWLHAPYVHAQAILPLFASRRSYRLKLVTA